MTDPGASGQAPGGPSVRMPAAPIRLTCHSPAETRDVGIRLGRTAHAGEVIALQGDLGAGKTCLIQGLAEGLGVTSPVTSPTFVLIGEHRGRLPLYHVDLYRLDSLAEVRALGLEDLLADWRDGVTAIEWAERAEALLPPQTVWLRLEGAGDEARSIEVSGLGPGRLEGSGA